MRTLSREAFTALFCEVVKASVARTLPGAVPTGVTIELHGADSPGDRMTLEAAAERLFLGEDRFHLLIDVMARRPPGDGPALVFCRPSDHPPTDWDNTWDPTGWGPFKLLEPIADPICPTG